MEVLRNPTDVRAWRDRQQRLSLTVALVPTMGALHDGHVGLIRSGQSRADSVVASIFVNPLQFDRDADLDSYPRPIDQDLERCASEGVTAVYAPRASEMYPPGFDTRVVVGSLATEMEGKAREGHFDGVTTVVAKLLVLVRPHVAIFGEKDFQQLAIVRQMAVDLDTGVEIVSHPTQREDDGLAMSSRNALLTTTERTAARCVPRALHNAVDSATDPANSVGDILAAARSAIEEEPLVEIEYVSVFDAKDLAALELIDNDHRLPGAVRIALAVHVGDVRLIDNCDLFRA